MPSFLCGSLQKSYRNYFTLIFIFWFQLTLSAQNKADQISNIMSTYHKYNMFDGAVLVAENGKIIFKDAYGLANREWNIPNTPETKFMIGSVSKPITATLILILVQKGLIDLDKSLDEYLIEFKEKPAAKVTVKQLLSHSSGMPNYDIIKDFFPKMSRQFFTREDYVKLYQDAPLAFTPGTKYLYSSWAYFTLGYIIEKVTGKSYAQAMEEEIFDKLGMKNSGSYYHTQIVPKRASGYDYGLGNFLSADFRDQSNTMGTGDLYSTVEDLFKFHMALANHSLLNMELTKEMFTPGIKPARYGFGWYNQNFRYTATDSVSANYHLGSTDGFISFMIRIPETNSMAVILCNSYPTDYFGIIKDLLKVLYNKPVILKEPIHKKMESLIGQFDAEKAVAEYKIMKMDTAHFYADWLQLYYLGENLVSFKRYDDARIIVENNVQEFPDKYLNTLSMANIYLNLNKREEAIKFYKKTLELNPDIEEAKNRLKELNGK